MLADGDFESFKQKGNRLQKARRIAEDADDFSRKYRRAKELNNYAEFRRRSTVSQVKDAFKIASAHRQAIKEGDFSVFQIAFVVAIAQDCISLIPGAKWIIGVFCAAYLFVFLWGRGRWKVRLAFSILTFFEFLPVIGILPLQTVSVWYAYIQAKKEVELANEVVRPLAESL